MRINTSKTDATEATTTTRSKPSKGQLIAGTILGLAVIGGIANVLGGGNDSAATTPASLPPSVSVQAPAPVQSPGRGPGSGRSCAQPGGSGTGPAGPGRGQLLPDTVIKVDGQRTTAGIYGACWRVIQLWRDGHRIEVEL